MVDTKITLNFIIIISLIVVALIYSKHSNKYANKNILLFIIVAFIFTFSKLNSKNELNIENFNSGLNEIRYIREINLDKSPENLPDLKSMSLNNKNELKVLTYDKQDHIPAYGDDSTIKQVNIDNKSSTMNIKDSDITHLLFSNYNDNSKFIEDSIKRDYKFNIEEVDYAAEVGSDINNNEETPIEIQERALYQSLIYPKKNKDILVDSINNDFYKSFYNSQVTQDLIEESIKQENSEEESSITEEQGTSTEEQGTSTEEQGTSTEEQGTSTEEQGTSTEEQGTSTEEQGTSTEEQGTSTEEQGTSTEEQGTSTEEQGTSTEEQGTSTEEQGTSTEEQGTSTEEQGTSTEEQGTSTEGNIITRIIENIYKLVTDNLTFTSNVESDNKEEGTSSEEQGTSIEEEDVDNKEEGTSSEEQGTSIEEEDVDNLYSKIENILQTINEFIRNIFINIYNLLSGDSVEQDTEEAGSEGFVRTILDYITDFFELLILFVTDVMVNISNAFNRNSQKVE
jgi:hypothetical protein